MKIRFMSDLHLEFNNKTLDFVVPVLPHDQDTTLVLAGDVALYKQVPVFLEECSKQFKHVVYILGNHEFYKANLPTVAGKIRGKIEHLNNVHFLDTEAVELDGVHFVGATLWSDMDRGNEMTMYTAKLLMNDYKSIRIGPTHEPWRRRLAPVDTCAMHIQQRDFMFDTMNEIKEHDKDAKIVAISHHLPSFICLHEDVKTRNLNGAYASELFDEIHYTQPDLWIYGHTHFSGDIIPPGIKTRLVCNPRGYWPEDLNSEFDPNLLVEV